MAQSDLTNSACDLHLPHKQVLAQMLSGQIDTTTAGKWMEENFLEVERWVRYARLNSCFTVPEVEVPTARRRIYSSSTTVASGDGVLIDAWDSTDFALGGTSVDSSSITVPTEGIYQVSAQVLFGFDDVLGRIDNAAASQVWSGTEDDALEFDNGVGGTWFTTNVGGGAGSLVAAFDGVASVTGYANFNDNTSDGTFELVLQVDGATAATSGTYDLTQSASTFDLSVSAIVDCVDGVTDIKLLGRLLGSTSGSVDMTGVDEHYLQATRLDAPAGVEAVIVQRDSGGSVVDAVAVSAPSDRRALATNVALQAVAGDYFEVWAWNPSTNPDVIAGPPIYNLPDSVHKWAWDTNAVPIYAEFQVAWVGPGAGTRPGGGGG